MRESYFILSHELKRYTRLCLAVKNRSLDGILVREGQWRPTGWGICNAERTSGWNMKGHSTQMSINVLFFSPTSVSKKCGGFEASVLCVGARVRSLAVAFELNNVQKKKLTT